MAFHGISIIFDGVASETYNLYLMGFDNKSGSSTRDLSMSLEIITDYSANSEIPYLQGVRDRNILTFPLTLSSKKPLDRYDIEHIQRWLFGHKQYKKLQIVQEDYHDIHFNCILNKPKEVVLNNEVYGFEFTVECNSAFGWQFPKTRNYPIASPQTIFFTNESSVNDYMYPTIEFMCTKQGGNGSVSIINQKDNNREFKITKLYYGETIIADSRLGIIKSSLDRRILGDFNKQFLRLVPCDNKLIVTGDITSLKITWQNMRRVGG